MESKFTFKEIYGEDAYRYEQLCCPAFHAVKPDIYDKESFLEIIKNADNDLLSDVTEGGNRFVRAGAFIDEQLVSAMEVYAFEGNFDGNKCEMNGIGGVLTDPDVRRSGAMTKLYSHLFEKMNESGQVFSHLYPFTMQFYRKYGYELACREVEWTIPSDYLPQEDFQGMVRYDNNESQQKDIRKVFEDFKRDYNLSVDRSERAWKRFFDSISPYTTRQYSYLHYKDGAADGFFSYTVVDADEDVRSFSMGNRFWFTSKQALLDMLRFMGSLRAYYKNLIVTLPENIDLSYALAEICGGWGKKNVKKEIHDVGATRIVNVEKALELARYAGSGTIRLKVNDRCCPWNQKIFQAEFDVRCLGVRECGQYDMELDIGALTALLLGYRSLDDSITMPNVTVYGNAENLKKVFYKKNVWTAEHF